MNKYDEGFALIAVLGLMLMLSVIALGIMQYAAVGARAASGESQLVTDKYLAHAALAQFEHEVIANARARSNAGGEHNMKVLGSSVALKIESENSRLNINRASEEEIKKFLVAKELDEKDAERSAARIIDWRDADNLKRPGGAEAMDYRERGIRPRNSYFESVGELRSIIEAQNVSLDMDNFTIYSSVSGGKKVDSDDIIGRSVGVARITVSNNDKDIGLVARLLPTSDRNIIILKVE